MLIMFITLFSVDQDKQARVRYVIGHWSVGTSNQKKRGKISVFNIQIEFICNCVVTLSFSVHVQCVFIFI